MEYAFHQYYKLFEFNKFCKLETFTTLICIAFKRREYLRKIFDRCFTGNKLRCHQGEAEKRKKQKALIEKQYNVTGTGKTRHSKICPEV